MVLEEERIALAVGEGVLNAFKEHIGEDEYDKIMSEQVKGCKCGFIQKGDYTICPKCEESEAEK